MNNRIINTLETTISKIFPAGVGWQTFSLISENLGFQNSDITFYIITGCGDSLFVTSGHLLYYFIKKKMLNNKNIDLKKEFQISTMYGTAALLSGTSWQPTVNLLQNYELSFYPSMITTGLITGTMFYGGLRFSRIYYSGIFKHIEKENNENLKKDIQLSLSIGGATAFFLGTDISYAPNLLSPILGIENGNSGILLAGLSTSIGFNVVQNIQNFTSKKNWTD